MSVIRIGGFRGEFPRIHPRFLPDGGSQEALNIRVDSGALESIKDTDNLQATTLSGPISLYRYSSSIWLEATTDVDWVPYPVADDIYGRVIFADPAAGELRVTDASLVGTGGYPANYRRLDIPAPAQGFSATLQGVADDEDEVPETRFYVCTFVNSWGAEGPPSPASNQVEWRTGQTVLLEGLPSVPTGNYDISHRRIYRINTGSSGVTNYQYVTEVAVVAATKNILSITQANPVVVTTTTVHGLTDGQEVVFAGLGLDATSQALGSPFVSKTNPATVHVTGHGFTTGQTVLLSNLTFTTPTGGMEALQDLRSVITVVNADAFTLDGLDATAFTNSVTAGDATLVYGMDELDDNSYVVQVIDTTSYSLIGIDGTGFFAYAEGGTAKQVSGTTYVDGIPTGSLAEVIPTELYDPPNDDTIGIKTHPSGFLAGFFGKTLAFSELGAPHAWPIDYRLATTHDIVGLGVFGNTVAVVTKGWPYLAIGSDPSAMTMVELEIEQACVAKRGIVDFGSAIAYPSPDGLIVLSSSGAENATAAVFTRDQWQALVPSSFVAFNWEQKYLCFYDDGTVQRGFILDPAAPGDGVKFVDKYVMGAYKDLEEDMLYTLNQDTNTAIKASASGWLDGGSIASLDFGTSDFTIEFLAKHSGQIDVDYVPMFGQRASTGGWDAKIYDDGTDSQVQITLDDGTIQWSFGSAFYAAVPDDGEYHHLAITVDRTNNEVRLYKAGALIGGPYNISAMGSIDTGTSNFRVFTDHPTPDTDSQRDYWGGSLDEIRIWSSVRTAAEILANKDIELAGTESNLLAYWAMNGTAGTVVSSVADSSTNSNALGVFQADAVGGTGVNYVAAIRDSIEQWDQGSAFQYTWKSRPTYTPHAVNMAGAKVIADDYPATVDFYVDDIKRHTRIVTSLEAFRLPGGFKGEKFEIKIRSKKRVSEVIMATTMRELSVTV